MSLDKYKDVLKVVKFYDAKTLEATLTVLRDYSVVVEIVVKGKGKIYERKFRDLVQLSTWLEKTSNLLSIVASIRLRAKLEPTNREPSLLVEALRDTVNQLLNDTSLLPETINALIKKAYEHLNLYKMIEITGYRVRIFYRGKQAYTDLIPRNEFPNVMIDINNILEGHDEVQSRYTAPLIPLLHQMRNDGLDYEKASAYITIEYPVIGYFYVGKHTEFIVSDKRLPPTIDSYNLVPVPRWLRDRIIPYASNESLRQLRKVVVGIDAKYRKLNADEFIEELLNDSYLVIRGVVGTEYHNLLKLFNEIKKVLFDEEVIDRRLAIVYKGYVIPCYRPNEMLHGLLITNTGVGKSTLASIVGEVIDNATGVSLMGTVESIGHGQYREIPSILHGRNYLHQIEDMEAPKSGWDYGPIFNYFVSGVINRYVRGHVVKSYATASLVFTMNINMNVLVLLDKFIKKWGSNATGIARRMDLFVFGEDFARPKTRLSDEFKMRAKAIIKLLQLSKETERLWNRLLEKAESWINEQSEDLPFEYEPKESYANDLEKNISDFLVGLLDYDDKRLKYHALRCALVDYILEYYEGKISEDKIIEKAKEYYEELRILRLKSMNQLKMHLQGLSFQELLVSASDVLQLILKKVAEEVANGRIKPQYGVIDISYDDIMELLDKPRDKNRARDYLKDTFIRGRSKIQYNIAKQLGIDVFHEKSLKTLRMRIPQSLIDYMIELVRREGGENNE